MLKSSAIVITLVLAPLPALAYTQSDADACTQDAFRLCQAAIPDASRVAHCLAQNKRNLSPACKIVFSRPNTARASTRGNSGHSSSSHDLY
jgi:hypothetical protein